MTLIRSMEQVTVPAAFVFSCWEKHDGMELTSTSRRCTPARPATGDDVPSPTSCDTDDSVVEGTEGSISMGRPREAMVRGVMVVVDDIVVGLSVTGAAVAGLSVTAAWAVPGVDDVVDVGVGLSVTVGPALDEVAGLSVTAGPLLLFSVVAVVVCCSSACAVDASVVSGLVGL